MHTTWIALGALALCFTTTQDTPQDRTRTEPAFTDTFFVEPSDFTSTGRNPFFVLEPGYRLVLEGKDGEHDGKLVVTVLEDTKVVDGVTTRVVEEREWSDGELEEVSRNFFALSKRTNDVFYFGEEVDIYEDGKVVKHEGAWLAGENGARFGLLMPGSPLLGARYCQEIAPKVAMDRAEVLSVTATMSTPNGEFERCLQTRESSAIEKGSERKTYAPGIGLIQEEGLKLVDHGKP